jgi:hypothetical protein
MRAFRALVLFLVLGCVSRSLPEGRFIESRSLTLGSVLNAVSLADPDKFSFVAVGDLHILGGDTSRLERILDGASAAGDSFIVLLGDNVDQGDTNDVTALWDTVAAKGWAGKVAPVIGNHDVFYDGWDAWRNANGPSHYTFSAGNSRFVVLDTADGTLGESHLSWFEEKLREPRPTNLFVLSHYAPVVPGVRTYLRLSDETEALRVRALAKRYGVSSWLAAHYHSFVEGTVDGVRYVVAGGGGGRRMPPVLTYFYVRVKVDGASVTTEMLPVE